MGKWVGRYLLFIYYLYIYIYKLNYFFNLVILANQIFV